MIARYSNTNTAASSINYFCVVHPRRSRRGRAEVRGAARQPALMLDCSVCGEPSPGVVNEIRTGGSYHTQSSYACMYEQSSKDLSKISARACQQSLPFHSARSSMYRRYPSHGEGVDTGAYFLRRIGYSVP